MATATTAVVELAPYRRSADEAPAEAHGDRLGTIGGADLAEQPPGVCLHSVLGEVQLASNFCIATTTGHSTQDLQFPFGERRGRSHLHLLRSAWHSTPS